jgi:uncharacterized protein (TIGR02145 family)
LTAGNSQQTKFAKTDLDVTSFRNGDPLLYVNSEAKWKKAFNDAVPAYCYVEDDPSKGVLYNWAALKDERGLAPYGWQLPEIEDFEGLKSSYLQNKEGTWKSSVWPYSGFNANAKGYKSYDGGIFLSQDEAAYYWTATRSKKSRKSVALTIWDGDAGFTTIDERRESFMSVRCVRNPKESIAPERINGKTNICYGEDVELSVVGGELGENSEFVWYKLTSVGEYEIGRGLTKIVTPTSKTRYGVRAENLVGEKTELITIEIKIHEKPKLPTAILGDKIVCEGATVRYEASGIQTYGDKWNWYVNGSFSGSGKSFATELYTSSSYNYTTISVRVENVYCSNDSEIKQEVKVLAVPDQPQIRAYINGKDKILTVDQASAGYNSEWVWYIRKGSKPQKEIGRGKSISIKKNSGSAQYLVQNEGKDKERTECGVKNHTYSHTKPNIFKPKKDRSGTGYRTSNYTETDARAVNHWGFEFGADGYTTRDSINRTDFADSLTPLSLRGYGLKIGLQYHPIINNYFTFGVRGSFTYLLSEFNKSSVNDPFMHHTSSELSYYSYKSRLGGEMAIGFLRDGKARFLFDYDLQYHMNNNYTLYETYDGYNYTLHNNRYERIGAGFRFGSYGGKPSKNGINFDILYTLTKLGHGRMYDFSNTDWDRLNDWYTGFELDFWAHSSVRIHVNGMFNVPNSLLGTQKIDLKQSTFNFGLIWTLDGFK